MSKPTVVMTPGTLMGHSVAGCVITLGALACSAKTVDLGNNSSGQPEPVYAAQSPAGFYGTASDASVTPFRIVDKEQVTDAFYQAGDCIGTGGVCFPTLFAVASGRLCWLSLNPFTNPYQYNMKSCDVDCCASSLAVSQSRDLPIYHPIWGMMRVNHDMVYWIGPNSEEFGAPTTMVMVSQSPSAEIRDVTWPTHFLGDGFQVADGVLYATNYNDMTVYQCNAADCANTIKRFAMNTPPGEAPFTGGTFSGRTMTTCTSCPPT